MQNRAAPPPCLCLRLRCPILLGKTIGKHGTLITKAWGQTPPQAPQDVSVSMLPCAKPIIRCCLMHYNALLTIHSGITVYQLELHYRFSPNRPSGRIERTFNYLFWHNHLPTRTTIGLARIAYRDVLTIC